MKSWGVKQNAAPPKSFETQALDEVPCDLSLTLLRFHEAPVKPLWAPIETT